MGFLNGRKRTAEKACGFCGAGIRRAAYMTTTTGERVGLCSRCMREVS